MRGRFRRIGLGASIGVPFGVALGVVSTTLGGLAGVMFFAIGSHLALTELAERWAGATSAGDWAAFAALLSDDFMYRYPDFGRALNSAVSYGHAG